MNPLLYKVLLAEESPIIQKVIEDILENEGFQIKTVCTGDEALEELFSFNPHIVMTSSDLQGTDGYELCRKIKTAGINTYIPVILLAGAYEPFDEDYARLVGLDDYILKPFEASELVGKAKKLLKIVGFETYDPPIYHDDCLPVLKSEEGIPSIQAEVEDVIIVEKISSTTASEEASFILHENKIEDPNIADKSLVKIKESPESVSYDEISNLLKKPLEEVFDHYLKLKLSQGISLSLQDNIKSLLYEIAPQMIDDMVRQKMDFVLSSIALDIENEIKKVLPEIIKTTIKERLEKVN